MKRIIGIILSILVGGGVAGAQQLSARVQQELNQNIQEKIGSLEVANEQLRLQLVESDAINTDLTKQLAAEKAKNVPPVAAPPATSTEPKP
jgi:hypothetical protein